MNNKLKTMVFGGFFAASLMISAAPAMARDWRDRDRDRDYRWEQRDRRDSWWDSFWGRRDSYSNRGDSNDIRDWAVREYGPMRGSRRDFDELEQARQNALYKASHGASRKEIAEANARVDEIANRMRYGR